MVRERSLSPYKLPLFCFKIISHQAPTDLSDLLHILLLPGSSALLQTPERSEYHPFSHSPVVSALSLTRLQLPGTNSLISSVMLLPSVCSNIP